MAIVDHYLVLGISRRENFRGIRETYQEPPRLRRAVALPFLFDKLFLDLLTSR